MLLEIAPHQIPTAFRTPADQRLNGIDVNDPTNDRYFVPLDKSAEADIAGGLLNMFYEPVDFYVDWSKRAVEEMKSLPGARFQNAEFYFRKGVSFSPTGLYCPTLQIVAWWGL
jgi:hypothetical protein